MLIIRLLVQFVYFTFYFFSYQCPGVKQWFLPLFLFREWEPFIFRCWQANLTLLTSPKFICKWSLNKFRMTWIYVCFCALKPNSITLRNICVRGRRFLCEMLYRHWKTHYIVPFWHSFYVDLLSSLFCFLIT